MQTPADVLPPEDAALLARGDDPDAVVTNAAHFFRLRGEAWMVLSGAKADMEGHAAGYYAELVAAFEADPGAQAEQIEKDVRRSGVTSGDVATYDRLRRVLSAVSLHVPQVGYCQSMNFLCAFLLRHVGEEAAFFLLARIVSHMLPQHYVSSMIGVRVDTHLFNALVSQYLPDVSMRLTEMDASVPLLCMHWFLCIFVGVLPDATVDRVWDCVLVEGPLFIVKVALALVDSARDCVLRAGDLAQVTAGMKAHLADLKDADALVAAACAYPFTDDMLAELRERFRQDIAEQDAAYERAAAQVRSPAHVRRATLAVTRRTSATAGSASVGDGDDGSDEEGARGDGDGDGDGQGRSRPRLHSSMPGFEPAADMSLPEVSLAGLRRRRQDAQAALSSRTARLRMPSVLRRHRSSVRRPARVHAVDDASRADGASGGEPDNGAEGEGRGAAAEDLDSVPAAAAPVRPAAGPSGDGVAGDAVFDDAARATPVDGTEPALLVAWRQDAPRRHARGGSRPTTRGPRDAGAGAAVPSSNVSATLLRAARALANPRALGGVSPAALAAASAAAAATARDLPPATAATAAAAQASFGAESPSGTVTEFPPASPLLPPSAPTSPSPPPASVEVFDPAVFTVVSSPAALFALQRDLLARLKRRIAATPPPGAPADAAAALSTLSAIALPDFRDAWSQSLREVLGAQARPITTHLLFATYAKEGGSAEAEPGAGAGGRSTALSPTPQQQQQQDALSRASPGLGALASSASNASDVVAALLGSARGAGGGGSASGAASGSSSSTGGGSGGGGGCSDPVSLRDAISGESGLIRSDSSSSNISGGASSGSSAHAGASLQRPVARVRVTASDAVSQAAQPPPVAPEAPSSTAHSSPSTAGGVAEARPIRRAPRTPPVSARGHSASALDSGAANRPASASAALLPPQDPPPPASPRAPDATAMTTADPAGDGDPGCALGADERAWEAELRGLTVDVREVVLGLIVFCEADRFTKLALSHATYDAEQVGALTPEQLRDMVTALHSLAHDCEDAFEIGRFVGAVTAHAQAQLATKALRLRSRRASDGSAMDAARAPRPVALRASRVTLQQLREACAISPLVFGCISSAEAEQLSVRAQVIVALSSPPLGPLPVPPSQLLPVPDRRPALSETAPASVPECAHLCRELKSHPFIAAVRAAVDAGPGDGGVVHPMLGGREGALSFLRVVDALAAATATRADEGLRGLDPPAGVLQLGCADTRLLHARHVIAHAQAQLAHARDECAAAQAAARQSRAELQAVRRELAQTQAVAQANQHILDELLQQQTLARRSASSDREGASSQQ